MSVISIDIGSKNIHLVEGSYQKGFVEIEKAVSVPAPPNSVVDGRIENIPSMKQFVRSVLAQNKLKSKQAFLTVHGMSIVIREITLPAVNPLNLMSAVRFEMEQYLPVSVSEYVIDHKVIEQFTEDNIKKFRVRVAAIPRDMVESYYAFLKGIGMKPLIMDIQSNSVSKLFSPGVSINGEVLAAEGTVVLIDVGHKFTGVNIISKGKLDLTRVIAIGGKDIDQVLAKQLGLPVEKAEQKKVWDLSIGADIPGTTPEGRNDPVKSFIDQWLSEIQKVIQYYTSKNNGSRQGMAYIYGGGANLKGLPGYMEQFLNLRVRKLENISSIKFNGKTGEPGLEYFLNAAGTMIRR